MENHEHQELCELYKNAAANIEARKNGQWNALLYFSSGVAFLLTQADNMQWLPKVIILITLPFGAVAAVKMMAFYQDTIKKERDVLHNIYSRFGQPFRNCREPKGDVRDHDSFELLLRCGGIIYIVALSLLAIVTFYSQKSTWLICGVKQFFLQSGYIFIFIVYFFGVFFCFLWQEISKIREEKRILKIKREQFTLM